MNEKKFQYYVLKYRPSLLLDERVNIGLLFVFEEDGNKLQLRFIYPKNLQRLNSLYYNLNTEEILSYLNIFERTAIELSGQLIVFPKIDYLPKSLKNSFKEIIDNQILISDVNKIIPIQFLLPDSNSLFFTKPNYGEYNDIEKITTYYKEKYFGIYNFVSSESFKNKFIEKSYLQKEITINSRINNVHLFGEPDFFIKKENTHNEKYLVHLLDKTLRLKAENEQDLNLFEKDYKIEGKLVTTKFDYVWQNGTANLVKSISLDLKQKRSIQQKSVRWYGELSQLVRSANDNNYRFDLLVTRPQDKKLFLAYDKALKVLDNIEANKKIIEENAIEDYAIEALNSVKPLQPIVFE